MADDDDDEIITPDKLARLGDRPEFQQKPRDIAKEYIAFLDEAVTLAAPPDLFGSQKNPNAWFNLQTSASRDKFPEIHVWVGENTENPSNGEINHKVGAVITLIKQRFNNPDAYKVFNSDIGKRIKRLKEKATQEKFTTKDIPDGR